MGSWGGGRGWGVVHFQQWVLEQPVLLGHRPKSEGDENIWVTTKSCSANKVTDFVRLDQSIGCRERLRLDV